MCQLAINTDDDDDYTDALAGHLANWRAGFTWSWLLVTS